jgi:hypothetical protein
MSQNKFKTNDGATMVFEHNATKQKLWEDEDNLKTILEIAFPHYPILSMAVLHTKTVNCLKESKITDWDNSYTISQVRETKSGLQQDRWIISVLRVNNETNQVVFKYVHPITMEVFDDPHLVDIATLPRIN